MTALKNEALKAFKPRHVFRAEELPKGKQHLAGGIYFGDGDGRVFVRLFEGLCSWESLKRQVDALGEKGACMPARDDWIDLFKTGLAQAVGLQPGDYWTEDDYSFDPYVKAHTYRHNLQNPLAIVGVECKHEARGYGYVVYKVNSSDLNEPRFEF